MPKCRAGGTAPCPWCLSAGAASRPRRGAEPRAAPWPCTAPNPPCPQILTLLSPPVRRTQAPTGLPSSQQSFALPVAPFSARAGPILLTSTHRAQQQQAFCRPKLSFPAAFSAESFQVCSSFPRVPFPGGAAECRLTVTASRGAPCAARPRHPSRSSLTPGREERDP